MNERAGGESQRRPVIAAAFALVVPGAGHAYARAWIRALLWAALFVTSLWFLTPGGLLAGLPSVDVLADAYSDTPDLVLFALAVWVMNVVDAYLTTSRRNRRASTEQSCPHCGRELDSDLEFCHWCTTPIDDPDPGER
ncbi:MAG: hypothetical protein J07HX64_01918 [halophilic archaeon J07HX64]|nr:MAG: hypothetical protein J07HX64_01918 [halophilic archaeon J07HX64]